MPNVASIATRSCKHGRVDRARSGGCCRPSAGRAPVRGAPVSVPSMPSATRSMPSRRQADVAPHERGEDVDHGRLLDRVEPADRPEVDQSEGAVGEGEDVPRMRIGVEEADPEHLFERRAKQLFGELRAVDAGSLERVRVGQRETVEALLHEQPARAEVSVHLRDATLERGPSNIAISSIASASCRKSSSSRRLCRELPEQLARAHALPEHACAAARAFGERARARRDRARCTSWMPGRCTLTTTRSPVPQLRAVGLTDRRRGERLPVELGEHLARLSRRARPGAPGASRSTGTGATRFCSCARSATDLGREEVDAGRGDLAELDVDAAGLFEDAPQPHPAPSTVPIGPWPARQERPESFAAGEAQQLAVARSTAMRRRIACTGRGATTRPARSPMRERPGRASRSSVDRDGHRGRDRRSRACGARVLGAPVPVREVRARGVPRSPNRRHPRRAPAPIRAGSEQPQRDCGRQHRDERSRRGRAGSASGTEVASTVTIPRGTAARPRRRATDRCRLAPCRRACRAAGTRARCRRRRSSAALASPSNAKR